MDSVCSRGPPSIREQLAHVRCSGKSLRLTMTQILCCCCPSLTKPCFHVKYSVNVTGWEGGGGELSYHMCHFITGLRRDVGLCPEIQHGVSKRTCDNKHVMTPAAGVTEQPASERSPIHRWREESADTSPARCSVPLNGGIDSSSVCPVCFISL